MAAVSLKPIDAVYINNPSLTGNGILHALRAKEQGLYVTSSNPVHRAFYNVITRN